MCNLIKKCIWKELKNYLKMIQCTLKKHKVIMNKIINTVVKKKISFNKVNLKLME